jgi:hypothetical protein
VSAWKGFERDSAALFAGKRFWANAGERVDFRGELFGLVVHGQCKLVQRLSLEELTKLAEEGANHDGLWVVCTKVRRGQGSPSSPLVVMTFNMFKRLTEATAR